LFLALASSHEDEWLEVDAENRTPRRSGTGYGGYDVELEHSYDNAERFNDYATRGTHHDQDQDQLMTSHEEEGAMGLLSESGDEDYFKDSDDDVLKPHAGGSKSRSRSGAAGNSLHTGQDRFSQDIVEEHGGAGRRGGGNITPPRHEEGGREGGRERERERERNRELQTHSSIFQLAVRVNDYIHRTCVV